MASLGQWTGGAVSVYPTTSYAAPNALFPTEDRNDSSIFTWTSSTSTVTLPASDLADGYLFIAMVEVESSHNNRANPNGKFVQASGTGTFVSAIAGGYCRDNSEDRAYISVWAFVDGPSASSTYQFQWKRDAGTGTPAGATVRSTLQVIPLYYSDWAAYTSTSTGLYDGTTPNLVTGWSGTDGTNITEASDVISVTGDNKRYLCFGSQYTEGRGAGGRTQRWMGFEIDGTFDRAGMACVMYRDGDNDESGGCYYRLIETVTATRTIEHNCYQGDGVLAGEGGCDDGESTPGSGSHACVVLELNDDAEVWSSTDETAAQEIALTGPVDITATNDEEFSDGASFDVADGTVVGAQQGSLDTLVLANVGHARETNSIGSGSRFTMHGEVTIDGVEQTDVFHGNYNRGNQSSGDCHGSSTNILGFVQLADGEAIGISNQELSGTEGGNGDIETQPGWVGFGLVNLSTLEASAPVGGPPPSLGLLGVGA